MKKFSKKLISGVFAFLLMFTVSFTTAEAKPAQAAASPIIPAI